MSERLRRYWTILIAFLGFYSYTQELMEVGGASMIQNSEDETPAAGTIRYNPGTSDFEGWNGLFWASLTGLQFEVGTVTDVDLNVYRTVRIDTQVWMAENLRTSKYKNGYAITFLDHNPADDLL